MRIDCRTAKWCGSYIIDDSCTIKNQSRRRNGILVNHSRRNPRNRRWISCKSNLATTRSEKSAGSPKGWNSSDLGYCWATRVSPRSVALRQRRQDRKSLRAALRAEIQAILAIVERREYLPGLSRFVEAIRVGSPNFFEVRIGKDYDIVFRSNCDKLGLLPPETAARTVGFTTWFPP